MRTYDEALAAARDGKAFSNGTEGYAWQGEWCDRCIHDLTGRTFEDAGCPLLGVALLNDKTPSEWMEQPWKQIVGRPEGETAPSLGDKYHCIEFRDESDPGPGYGPKPAPPLPGQLELFPVDGLNGPRMFVDVVAEIQPAAVDTAAV